MVEEIIVDIGPDGEITMDAKGFVGQSCSEVIGPLAAALGKQIEHKRKPEYYKRAIQKRTIQRGRR